jgi:hypothetical protein
MNLAWRTKIAAIILFAMALYVGLHISAQSSDGFKFVAEAIRQSPQIKARLGDVDSVRLSYIGQVRLKAVGSDRWDTFTLEVTGKMASATVVASATKRGGTWSTIEASIHGEAVSLR